MCITYSEAWEVDSDEGDRDVMGDDVMVDLPGLVAVGMSVPQLWYIRAINITPLSCYKL